MARRIAAITIRLTGSRWARWWSACFLTLCLNGRDVQAAVWLFEHLWWRGFFGLVSRYLCQAFEVGCWLWLMVDVNCVVIDAQDRYHDIFDVVGIKLRV